LTDLHCQILRPLIPEAKPGGRPRDVDIPEVMDTRPNQDRTGCQREMLPHHLPPKSTMDDYFKRGRDDGTWQRVGNASSAESRGRPTIADRGPATPISPGAPNWCRFNLALAASSSSCLN
jgi:transposase